MGFLSVFAGTLFFLLWLCVFGRVLLPPPQSISYRLIQDWLNGQG